MMRTAFLLAIGRAFFFFFLGFLFVSVALVNPGVNLKPAPHYSCVGVGAGRGHSIS